MEGSHEKYHAMPLFILGATLPRASPSYGQSCSTTVANNIGDRIQVTATLSSSDPNENGDGEALLITTSGGEFTTTDSIYALSQVYPPYTATAANETITGTNLRFDRDESCGLSATITSNAWLMPPQKAAASTLANFSGGIGTAAGVLAAACTGTFVSAPICGLPAVQVAAVSYGLAYSLNNLAKDPVDNNYTQLVKPVFPNAPLVFGSTVPPNVAAVASRLFYVQEREIGFSGALYTTANRAATAAANGATTYVMLQTNYANKLAQKLAALAALEARTRKELKYWIVITGIDTTLTAAQVLQFEMNVSANRLPPAVMSALQSLGVTDPNAIDLITNVAIVQDTNTVAGPVSSSLASHALIASLFQEVATYGGSCTTLYLVSAAQGTRAGGPGFLAAADLNGDGVVNGLDLAIAMQQTPNPGSCKVGEISRLLNP